MNEKITGNKKHNDNDLQVQSLGGDEPPTKKHRFGASATSQEYAWELPHELASYANDKIKKFIKEQGVNFEEMSSPQNIVKVKRLDPSFKEIFDEQHKKAILNQDELLPATQQKVIGLWAIIENLGQHGGR